MKRKMFNLSVILLSLVLGLTMTAMAEDPVKLLDTPEIKAKVEKARQLAGDDKYWQVVQRLQCRDINADGVPTQTTNSVVNPNVEPTQLFDNVYYVGGDRAGSFIITTSDGYILLDAMYEESPEKVILPSMKKLGLDPAKIKYLLITHAGPDHVGGAKYFQDNYGTHVVMSAQEWDAAEKPAPGGDRPARGDQAAGGRGGDRPERGDQAVAGRGGDQPARGQAPGDGSMPRMTWSMPKRDMVGTDGQTLTLGDTTITMVHTPRRVGGGGLSYIIPVFDKGTPHMWANYGNTNCVGGVEDKLVYGESIAHYLTYTDAAKVDVVISSHPFVDNSTDRMEELRDRKPGEANPFVIGQEKSRRYLEILDQCASVFLAREQAGLDETGTKRLAQ